MRLGNDGARFFRKTISSLAIFFSLFCNDFSPSDWILLPVLMAILPSRPSVTPSTQFSFADEDIEEDGSSGVKLNERYINFADV